MSYSNKKVSGLLLKSKIEFSDDDDDEVTLPIFNMNNLTEHEFKNLIQGFFDNDDHGKINDFDISNYYNDNGYIFKFSSLKNEIYSFTSFDEDKIEFKKSIIKFLNFLKNTMILSFELLHNDIDNDIDIICLIGDVIKNSKMISHVSFPKSYLKNDAFDILYKYMNDNKNIISLNFSFEHLLKEKIPDKNINNINNIIKSCGIEDIHGLDDFDYGYFFESLLINHFVRGKIDISKIRMDEENFFKLSNMIIDKNINYLKEIDFSWNKITPHGFLTLFGSLLKSNNENIIKLNIQHTTFDDDSVEFLGKLIKQNKNIFEINLAGNKITDKGVEILYGYIIGNTSINKIDLSINNGITNNSSKIIKYIVKSSYISIFNIFMTNINEQEINEIDEILKIPINKREIPFF